ENILLEKNMENHLKGDESMPDIAVLMPKDEEFHPVYESIEKLCQQVGFQAKKMDLSHLNEQSLTDIKNAAAAIVDISVQDFPAAIGIGILIAHDKVWIPISQKENNSLPKSTHAENLLVYNPSEEGLKKFQGDLFKALKKHRATIKEDVKHILKKDEVSYTPLKCIGENEKQAREYTLEEEKLVFVEIPEGPFLYGLAQKREDLPTFLMSKFLLTNEQWNHFLEATDYNWKGHWLGRPQGKLKRVQEYPPEMAGYPIVDISYYDLHHYVEWLNQEYGTKEIYFTLPSEKQWEKAARGSDGRRFPWGNEIPNHELALYEQDLRHGTAPVDSFHKGASPYGCLHMAGNVFEWTKSFYDFDFKSRVVRGGSYAIEPLELECHTRFSRRPEIGHWTTGGRICVLVW
ncbi:MAG: hypothetical protein D6785_14330, partial [Planctomycetota bacterium]